ncbi:MAG: Do family serine endopeptidase [Candidatus Omnitrophica bacterium]|nr:Do family serine endopeptidase [Candidatus Omnitrophota bacterium]
MKRFAGRLSFALLLGLCVPCGAQTASNLSVAQQMEQQFVDVAEKVGPAVVSISIEATERVRFRRQPFGEGPFSEFEDDLFDRFFRDFFGDLPEREFKHRGLGTGVLIDDEGTILTNEHVVHGADKVTVTLPDGREFKGQIKGTDLRSDLAVLKIPAKNLPYVELGDSDQVRIGQWAIAIGNPFGWAVGGAEPTLTVGVVSALNRSFKTGQPGRDYSDLIQTDAAINPGNSGGPLVNLAGQVIGINVAIFSTSGGTQGIGFAITSNTAKAVLGDLIQGKKILYGWLGVNVQDITEELSKHFGLESKEGVIVAKVLAASPAERGGLRDGDVIFRMNGEPLKDVRQLLKKVSHAPVGKEMELEVIRAGQPVRLSVKIGERPSEGEPEEKKDAKGWRGLKAGPITPEIAERFGLQEVKGVIVMDVEPGSAAEEAAFRPGDLIFEINRQPVRSMNDFISATQRAQGDVLVKTSRGYTVLRQAG